MVFAGPWKLRFLYFSIFFSTFLPKAKKLVDSQNFQKYHLKADKKTFRMSIYMLNKIWTEAEIFASNVDRVAAKNEKHFLLIFNYGVFLVGVLTIEWKKLK